MDNSMIFLSYSRQDKDVAKKIASDIISEGGNIWMDVLHLNSGERWDQAIEEALEKSSHIMVLLSKSSVTSHNVLDEVSYALEETKTIIPVLIENCKVPFRLRRLQRVDFTGDYQTGINQILSVLNLIDEKSTQSPTISSVTKTSNENENISKKPRVSNKATAFIAEIERRITTFENVGKQKDYVIKQPYILIYSDTKKLSSFEEIPVFENIAKAYRPLIIVASGFEGKALKYITPQVYKSVMTLALRAPGFGDSQKKILSDIAFYTGASNIEWSESMSKVTIDQLGETDSVRVNYYDKEIIITYIGTRINSIINSKISKKKIDEFIKKLTLEIQNCSSDYDKENLQKRIKRFQLIKDAYTFEYFDLSDK